jgi:PGF-pre-PGF domain-containing protein
MKNFDKELGIKEISISVKNEAQDVKITVIKYDGKPAQVAKEKSGKIYKYLQIKTTNLEEDLDKGKVTIKVEKSWLNDNSIHTEDVAMFKFNEDSEEWDQLDTSFVDSDSSYSYYDVELESFSYFAISEKVMVEAGTPETIAEETTATTDTGEEQVPGAKKSKVWLWVVITLLIAGAAGYTFYNRRMRKKLYGF